MLKYQKQKAQNFNIFKMCVCIYIYIYRIILIYTTVCFSTSLYYNLWGHSHCISPSSVQFSARQHDNTLSLPLSNPSLSVTRLHSQLQTKCSFPLQHLNTSIYSTSHTQVNRQLTNGRAGRTREVCIKMATFPA